MPIIGDKEREHIAHILGDLAGPVTLHVFAHPEGCTSCADLRQLMEELAAISGQMTLQVHDPETAQAEMEQYAIEKTPATAIIGSRDYGVRFYGVPAGYEFAALLEDIVDISKGEVELGSRPRENLKKLSQPVHVQVFTTPTCPVCPNMVRLAHRLAIASDLVRADAVDLTEFPALADRYDILAVPVTLVNETLRVEGLVPEGKFVADILRTFA